MKNFQSSHANNGMILLKLILSIVIIICTVYLSLESLEYYYKIQKLNENMQSKQSKANELRDSLKSKESELDNLNSDWGKEEYLRNTYRVAARDEKVVTIVDSTNTISYEIVADVEPHVSRLESYLERLRYYWQRYLNL